MLANLAHEVSKSEAHDNSRETAPDESFPGFLRTQLDQGGAPHGEAEHVGHDVVDDHHHDGHDEPDEPLKHVLDDEVALSDHAEQGHMGPGKQGELQEMKQMRNRLETVKLGKLGKTKEMI